MTGYHLDPTSDRLRIQCWCGAHYGYRPIRDVRAGRTFSCSPACQPATALTQTPGTQPSTARKAS